MLRAPIGSPEPRSYAPPGAPHIFLENGIQTVKMQFDTDAKKIKTAVISILCRDEKLQRFVMLQILLSKFSSTDLFRKNVHFLAPVIARRCETLALQPQ